MGKEHRVMTHLYHFLMMGGYGYFVWPAWGITFFIFIFLFVTTRQQQEQTLKKIRKFIALSEDKSNTP